MEADTHRNLIKTLWPDKALYGAILLFLTGTLGALYAVAALGGLEVTYGDTVPRFIQEFPPWGTLVLSVATAILAMASLLERKLRFAVAGVVTGVLSMSLAALGPLLALAAGWTLMMSVQEKEHTNPETQRLTPLMWPDKTLGASCLMYLAGLVTLFWGLGIAVDLFAFGGWTDNSTVFGIYAILAGVLALYSAYQLYWQRGPIVSSFAALLVAGALGLVVLGPLAAAGALVYITLALKEREFVVAIPGEAGPERASSR